MEHIEKSEMFDMSVPYNDNRIDMDYPDARHRTLAPCLRLLSSSSAGP